MAYTAAQSISQTKLVRISLIVEKKLQELETKLNAVETKLEHKENENMELCKTITALQENLATAEESQNRLTTENEQLKLELQTTTALHNSEIGEFEKKYCESKAEYQILSNQLDLLEEDVSNLVCENKQMLLVIETLQKSLKKLTASNIEVQNSFGKAHQDLLNLKQLVSYHELAAEETSTNILALQQLITQALNIPNGKFECTEEDKIKPTNCIPSDVELASLAENIGTKCNYIGQTDDKIPKEVMNNLNIYNAEKNMQDPQDFKKLSHFKPTMSNIDEFRSKWDNIFGDN